MCYVAGRRRIAMRDAGSRPDNRPSRKESSDPQQVPGREQLRPMFHVKAKKLPCGYIFIQF